jgi:hypothetical protein
MYRSSKLVAILAASCMLASGCFVIPVSYPKWSFLPGFENSSELSGCRVFRMDSSVTHTENHGDFGEYTLTEVLPDSDGGIPARTRFSLDKKYIVVGLVEGFHLVGEAHRMLLRLYRPGYELVELESWQTIDQVQWRPAKDWASQEKAIDGLLNGPPPTYAGERSLWNYQDKTFHHLPKLADSAAQAARPFFFAATEYERVATLAPTPEDSARLRDKSRRLVEVKAAVDSTPESP